MGGGEERNYKAIENFVTISKYRNWSIVLTF